MKNYEKPIVLANSELSEGVYAASGPYQATGSDCYKAGANTTQAPEYGRGSFCLHVDGKHNSVDGDGHATDSQTLVLTLSNPVEVVASQGKNVTVSPDGYTVYIDYSYHNNSSDNIGLSDVYVRTKDGTESGLTVTDTQFICNHN